MHVPHRHRRRGRLAASIAVVLTAGVAVSLPMVPGASSAPSAPSASKASAAGGTYAYYYLWWDTAHWHTSLGPSYPFGQSPL